MLNSRVVLVIGIVVAAALARLVPHVPNLTPVDALALFGGAYLTDRRLAFGVPLAAMLLSNAILGFDGAGQTLAVLGCSAITVALGIWVGQRRTVLRTASAAVSSALVFFVVTNLAVWAFSGLYPHTPTGLAACYVAAIPFLRYTMAGDLIYTAVLFGGFALLEQGIPLIRERQVLPR